MSDLFYRLLILRTPGIGPVKYNALIKKFGSAENAVATVGVDSSVRDMVEREMECAHNMNIHYICDDSEFYPHNLLSITNRPPVLTVRGNIETLQRPAVSIVGTRNATAMGIRFIENLAQEFVEHNIAVVSGMAMGTDAAAHRGALRADGNTNTIAVVAGGVDYIWPLENEDLYWEIVSRGAVVSEMPIGFKPVAQNFVQRNRWIAAIGDKLILGEADMHSGSMTTARFASDYDRDIYAIPSHPADSRSVGPNSLIRSGVAKLCMGPGDFFENDKKTSSHTEKITEKNDSENCILNALGINPVSESVLAEIVKKSVSEIKRDLVVLELQGLVQKIDGGYIKL